MDRNRIVAEADERDVRGALADILEGALTPAFGARTKKELELSIVEALVRVGALDIEPSVYDLVSGLRITKTKARALLYERELRRQTPESLDEVTKGLLRRPLLQNHAYCVALDVENPYVADHIRARIRMLGHASDGSFSPNLIRLSPEAAGALVSHYLSGGQRQKVESTLRKVTGEQGKAETLVSLAVRAAASTVAGRAGEELMDWGAEAIGSLLDANQSRIESMFRPLFPRGD